MSIEYRKDVSFSKVYESVGPEMSAENEHIIRLNFHDNGQVYIPSTDGLQFPAGASVSAARIATNGISAITSNAGVQTNIATISGTTIKIVDVDYALADIFGQKLAAGVGSRHKKVEIFSQRPGNPFSEDDLLYTFILENYENTPVGKTKILHCVDVSRQTSTEIFPEKKWTLVKTVETDSISIRIKADPEDDFRFIRGPHDNYYPAENIGYMRFGKTGEIWSYSRRESFGPDWWDYIVKDRGMFGTEVQAFLIDSETPVENNQEVIEHVYYQEDARDCALMATIGRTMSGRIPPAHWTPKVPEDLLNVLSITTSRFSFPLEIEAPKPQSAKTFYEDYILAAMSDSVFDINTRGQLELLPIDPAPPWANATETFNESNVDLASVSPLLIKQDNLANPITIKWDYSSLTDDYVNHLITSDLVAEGTHGTSEPMVIELPSFHTGTHTEPQVAQKMISATERYSNPTATIAMDVIPSMGIVKTGTLVRVTLPPGVVIDDSTGIATDLDRTFLVIGRRYNPSTRKVRYFLWGTSGKALERSGSTLASHIPDLEFTRGGISLASVLPISSGVLSGPGHSIAPGKYWYSGDLIIAPDFECSFTRRGSKMQLCVLGSLSVRSPNPFICKGMGPHAGGQGAAAGETIGQPGEPGYIGASVAGGGFELNIEFKVGLNFSADRRNARSTAGRKNAYSRVTAVPVLDLAVNDGRFTGVPVDLSGCGGAGGSAVWETDKGWDGYPTYGLGYSEAAQAALFDSWGVTETREFKIGGVDGEAGGMGLEFWSRGGGWDGAGGVVTDGANAAAYTGPGYAGFVPGAPGRSWPGAFVWIMDDPTALLPDVSEARVSAHTGEVYQFETRAVANEFSRDISEVSPKYYGWRSVTPRQNLAATAARAQYSPRPANAVRRSSSVFDSLAIARQQDGRIEIRITETAGVPPSNGLPGDMGIWRTDLEGNGSRPAAWIMTDAYTWVTLDWDSVESDYQTLLYVNRTWGGTKSILSPTRPVGQAAGTHWLNSADGTEWILGETAATDTPFRINGVPIGIELLSNGNFSEGDVGFIFTRDSDIQPRNILEVIADAIRDAFISHGVVEGEYIAENIITAPAVIPAPLSLTATVTSDTGILLNWTQPGDTTGVEGQYIYLNGVIFDATAGSSFSAQGLTKGTTYQFSIRNAGNNGALSSPVYATATTTDSTPPVGQIGIVFTHTGEAQANGTRKVAGTAYQNNASIPIGDTRGFFITLIDGSVITTAINGTGGQFEIFVSSAYDNNLGKDASAYGNNGTDSTKAQQVFRYEL